LVAEESVAHGNPFPARLTGAGRHGTAGQHAVWPAGGVGLFEVSVEQLGDRQVVSRATKITQS
jgi:hypothetical protein